MYIYICIYIYICCFIGCYFENLNSNCTNTNLLSQQNIQKRKRNLRDTAGEVRMKS